jgi:hypothetical protein
MANLKTGSSGSDVKKLQNALVAAGYDVGKTGADGVYGKNTAAAVKKYQKDNGLSVDGIAGPNTMGALYGGNTIAAGAMAGAQIAAGTKSSQPTTTAAKTAQNSTAGTAKQARSGSVAASTNGSVADNSDADVAAKKETLTTPVQAKPFEYDDFQYDDFTYQDYTASDVVNQANSMLQQHNANKPGEYQSQWQGMIDEYLGKIENRDPFSYDFNADALYQQYKDIYTQQGKMAMMDTMGQAQAMTGGYGNSYAQSVGQQAYNQQLNQLNEVMPQLYQMAYNRYADEGQQLKDMYNMYMGQESQDYSRYQTDLGNWYNELNYLTGRYESERDQDYKKYESNRQQAYNEYSDNRNIAYDDYASGKDIAYGQYTTEQDRAWEEYLKNQDKDQVAAELMAGTGNYDRLKEIYGLTDDEIAEIKKANTVYSGSVTKSYKSLTHSDLEKMQKAVNGASSVADLANLAGIYESMGYDPSVINGLTSGKYGEFADVKGLTTDVKPTGSGKLIDSNPNLVNNSLAMYGKGVYDPLSGKYVATK